MTHEIRAGIRGMVVGLSLLAACRLGRPPSMLEAASVGQVAAPVAEPGLGDDLSSGLGDALAARGVLGTGPRIQVLVLRADTVARAAGEGAQVHEARLEVRFTLGDNQEAPSVVLAGGQSYRVGGDALAASEARAAAFRELAERLAGDAVEWMMYAPRTTP